MSFELLTIEEAAGKARISRRCLDRRIAAGTGPQTLRVGRRVLVRSDAFTAWIDGLTAQSRRSEAAGLGASPAAPLDQPAAQEA